MATISVTIDGKTYRMACDEGQEEHLAGLAVQFDQYIGHLKSNFGEIGDHRLSVMAGIMVMDEVQEQKKTIEKLKHELNTLKANSEMLSHDATVRERETINALTRAALQMEKLTNQIAPK